MPLPAHVTKPKRLLVAAAAVLAVGGAAACDSTSGPAPSPDGDGRQVTVVGNGQVQGTPDTLTADVSMEFIAPDATAAMNQTSERQQAVIDALVDSGVAREDISTTQVRLQPRFGQDRVITGYRASNSIDVKIRELDTASQTLSLITTTGGDATRINSVDYSIEDDSELVKDARAQAFEDAKDRAEQYAGLSGLDLGNVISIEESSGSTPPTPMPRGAQAEAMAVPLEPGQQTVDFSVTVVWELA